jgi:hypothetical protein
MSVHDLAGLMAELAVDDTGDTDMWEINQTPINLLVSAATRELYADQAAAWDGARGLWQRILDLGYELTGEGADQIGAVRCPGQDKWRGKVRMVLEPFRLTSGT